MRMNKKVNLVEILRYLFQQAKPGQKFTPKAIEKITQVPATTIRGFGMDGKSPTLKTLEKLAAGFHIEIWQLLAPIEVLRVSRGTGLADLVNYFALATIKGRETILLVAQASPKKNQPISDP